MPHGSLPSRDQFPLRTGERAQRSRNITEKGTPPRVSAGESQYRTRTVVTASFSGRVASSRSPERQPSGGAGARASCAQRLSSSELACASQPSSYARACAWRPSYDGPACASQPSSYARACAWRPSYDGPACASQPSYDVQACASQPSSAQACASQPSDVPACASQSSASRPCDAQAYASLAYASLLCVAFGSPPSYSQMTNNFKKQTHLHDLNHEVTINPRRKKCMCEGFSQALSSV